ncbi:MAG: hypothetical protein KGD73_08725, partial [Candidatus Lokiarchaeota archaeon]|nr:hypothetical protein [Candidatus Lokiarchaeota archaeon]
AKLSKVQYKYINSTRKSLTDEKTAQLKDDISKQEKKLLKLNNKIIQKTNEIHKLEVNILNLKKQLSEKLSLREKIRPTINN